MHQAEFVALLAAIHKIAHGCHDLQVKGAVYFEDDTDRNNHGAKFLISVSVQHQASWKFCIHFYFGFVALLSEHQFLHALVTFCCRA